MPTLTSRFCRIAILLILPGLFITPASGETPAVAPTATATGEASPVASPMAVTSGCAALGSWFLDLASLIEGNDGMGAMQGVGFDVTRLSPEDAASVVTSLDSLIAEVEALDPPEPASAYHRAYLGMLGWYRDLAANQDPEGYQGVVNNDRALFTAMGQAIFAGQSACGADAWNAAWTEAFP